ncbi:MULTISPECIES: Na(+)/H(+) antiporter subunit C [Nocardia]|uniref:Multisubunit sodium/proton antiporter MrpC subunit n=2 Tax=Nocardia TaxID=1817 RepID=A0A4R6PX23_NOCIG|nr:MULTISPECIES: Na(+)/H(+) antiporter subunit C [Nocardia]MCA2205561.1 Na(+)/H(+) antiporter subunit C [Nocardia rosealba]NKX87698.1 Na(+)/H(+) antiporter subunit C [Nocardia coubleae]TDP42937.1 multisubunit sodium/proton antiporter MrpC subunit [Nocardia ignorata]
MSANLVMLLTIGALTACGVYLVLERVVSKMLLGIILLGNAVNLLILTVGGGPDGNPPVLSGSDTSPDGMADPLAQAMVLTAIVITMGLAAFVLALAYRAYRLTTTEDVRNDPEDTQVAARRESEDPAE